MVAVPRTASPSVDATLSPDSSTRRHTVQRGDTMYGLARANGLGLDELTRANPQVRDPARIFPGQEIQIPAAATPAPPVTSAPVADVEVATPTPADAATVTGTRTRVAAQDVNVRARLESQVPEPSGPTRAALTSTGVLRRNQDGPAVVELQQQLNLRGANLKVDGDFGRETFNAVRDFQRRQDLPADGVVGPDTRAAFAATAPRGAQPAPARPLPESGVLRSGAEGPAVEALQTRLNTLTGAGLEVDGDFGRRTRTAVENFQRRAGLEVDGEVAGATRRAMDEVEAGTRELAAPTAPAGVEPPARPDGPRSRTITAEGNTFRVHDMVRREYGTRSTPGNRIISLDSNSSSGRAGEILRPLVVIPNNATRAERDAAQAAVDGVARWLADNNPGQGRATTGVVRTTAENGRGLSGFFHTEFHSVNDTDAVALIRERPQDYARILAGTMGAIPGANFIVPHGNLSRHGSDPGAVAVDGTTEVGIAQGLVRNGFFGL